LYVFPFHAIPCLSMLLNPMPFPRHFHAFPCPSKPYYAIPFPCLSMTCRFHTISMLF
jgi:hypothetical protein